MKKYILFVIVVVFSPFSIAIADPADPNSTQILTLRDYLRYAALNNAELKGAFYNFRAAVEQIPQAQALPDPRITYSYFIDEVETRVGPQQQRLGFTQTFPWFGVIEARTDAAALAAKAAKQRYESVKLKLFNQVKQAFYEYAYLHHAIKIAEQNLDLLEHFEEVARIQYAAAAAGHPDVIRAQVEYARLADELESLLELRQPIQTRLNSILNRNPDKPLPWPERTVYEPKPVDEGRMLSFLRQFNPELTALDFEIKVARQRVILAEKRAYPDVTAGLEWIDTGRSNNPLVRDSGQDALMATVSFNLPIWFESNKALERQSVANMLKASSRRVQAENDLTSEVSQSVYKVQDASRKVALYSDILIPKATEMVSASETAYTGGTVDFLSLIDAQQKLLNYQLNHERAIADSLQALAELEMLTGGMLYEGSPLEQKINSNQQ